MIPSYFRIEILATRVQMDPLAGKGLTLKYTVFRIYALPKF